MRIRQLGDPILRQVANPVETSAIGSAELDSLVDRMQSILDGIQQMSSSNGNAISAPQVGSTLRVIVLRIDGQFVPMINPTYQASSDRTFECEEECFSMYQLRGLVTRHHDVQAQFLDLAGRPQSLLLSGEDAGLLQHEVDHLDGVLFIDRLATPDNLQSIEYTLKDSPARLALVQDMIRYMAS